MSEDADPETEKALEFIRRQIDFAQDCAEDQLVKEYRRVETLLMRLLRVEMKLKGEEQ